MSYKLVTGLAGHGSLDACLQSLAVRQHAHMSQTCGERDRRPGVLIATWVVSRALITSFYSCEWSEEALSGSWQS